MGALIIRPKPEHQGESRTPASNLKVYESSIRQADGAPLLTVYAFGDSVPFGGTGLRLDRRQVAALRDVLDDWLLGDGIEDERA